MDYHNKYQKYKFKYLNLLNQTGAGSYVDTYTDTETYTGTNASTNADTGIGYSKEYKIAVQNKYTIDDYKINAQNYGLDLKFVPPEIINSDVCKISVQNNGLALEFVPPNIKDSEICKIAVQQNGLALQFVPPKMINSDICKIAVQNNGLALFLLKDFNFFDINLFDINLLAVNNNWIILNLIDSNINLQIKYIITEENEKKRKKLFKMIEFLNDHIETLSSDKQIFYEYMINVQQNGLTLEFVPAEIRDSDICKIAVQQNGLTLEFVPPELRNSDICKIAVQQNGLALQFVPTEIKKSDICKIAVQQNGLALQFVQLKTENIFEIFEISKTAIFEIFEISKIAVRNNKDAINYVQQNLLTDEQNKKISHIASL